MTAVAKVAVTIPKETLRSLERARARQGKTRSAAVTEALDRWLASEAARDNDARYVEGYLRTPEQADDAAPVAVAVVGAWAKWK